MVRNFGPERARSRSLGNERKRAEGPGGRMWFSTNVVMARRGAVAAVVGIAEREALSEAGSW